MGNDFRERITRELAGAGRPPLGSLAADAQRAGERARRRRRTGLAMAASAVAVAVVLLAAGVTFGGGPVRFGTAPDPTLRPSDPSAGPSPGDPSPGPSGSPSAGPSASSAPPAGPVKPATGEAVIALLTSFLPPGGSRTEFTGGTHPHNASGGFVYDDGQGQATVSAGVSDEAMSYGSGPGMSCPPGGPGFVCELRTTPEGFPARVITMGPYGSGCAEAKCGIKDVRVEVARTGFFVLVESYNGPFGQGRPATRADTLLSVEQMLAIAGDPRWGLTMDASFVDAAATQVDLTP